MKILKLRFKNLNSLYGEWTIDFSQPDYADQGLFAITGPTGSGKSTILDAVCLALYGMTPRLGRITKSGNEIMSRQTGECFAEVTFASQAGTYICHWHQHRAYRRPDGILAEAVHEIADAVSGQVLETKKRDVALTIEEKTGMDFERFTRSVLLAQGSFAAFLQASPDERSPILEQITGTAIYSDLSIRVHERQRAERDHLERLRSELGIIRALSDDELVMLKNSLTEEQRQEQRLAGHSEALRISMDWLANISKHEQDLRTLDQRVADHQQLQASFLPQRQRLQQARRVLEGEGVYASLISLRQQQQTEQASLQAQANRLPELQQQQQDLLAGVTAAEKAVQDSRNALQAERPVLQQVRALDLQIAEALRQHENQMAGLRQQATVIEKSRREQAAILKELERLSQEYERVKAWLTAHAADEELVGQLAGLREQLQRLAQLMAEQTEKQQQAGAAGQRCEKAKQLLAAAETAVREISGKQKTKEEAISRQKEQLAKLLTGRTLPEYRREQNELMKSLILLRRIASLEEERKRLRDGQPCPLCGATEHPYSLGQVPAVDETEQAIDQIRQLIEQAERREGEIRLLETEVQAVARKLAESENRLLQCSLASETADAERQRSASEAQELKKQSESFRAGLNTALLPYGLVLPEHSDGLPDILNQLAGRVRQWQAMQTQSRELESKAQKNQAEIDRLAAVLDTRQEQLNKDGEQSDQQKSNISRLKAERLTLYGDKQADMEEQRLNQAAEQAALLEKEVRAKQQQVQTQLEQAKTRLTSLSESIAARAPQIEAFESQFSEVLKQLGLAGETAFLACRLPEIERSRLAEQADQLDKTGEELKVRRQTVEQALERERASALTDETPESLAEQRQAVVVQLQALRENIGAKKQKLQDHAAAKALAEAKQRQIDSQMKECLRWDKLRDLIGSADGKKFRNFAQGLTFERMVAQANRQLAQMSDRYLLIRNEKMPLELDVIDNYQAGEIRSTKNLSGGESFIVSLALALGLSRMASRKVRVDSLFLDEGFGTLDEEALETALETLSGLHQDGKLIGIISHVPALRERIRTQLTVSPVSGGRSVIAGPGVLKMPK